MKIAILGAGVVGVATAYAMAREGIEVVLIDEKALPGAGSSRANGGQLSYSYQTPIASPEVIRQLPGILTGRNPAFRIYPSLNGAFYKWCMLFLRECATARSLHSSKVMSTLGRISKKSFERLVNDIPIDFDYRKESGKVYLYSAHSALPKMMHESAVVWNTADIQKYLPAIGPGPGFRGAVYDHNEDAADSYKFCRQMVEYLSKHHQLIFMPSRKITAIEVGNDKVQAIHSSEGKIEADCYVLAAGAGSYTLAKSIGLTIPIYPMKGYSVTVPARAGCPDMSVTDTATRTVYCRLGDRLRIAGFAEFSDGEPAVNKKCIDIMLNNAKKLMPLAGDYDHVIDQWCGIRPATPDSLPIVSASRYSNLYLNTGHGVLGWSHSAGTADILVNLIQNRGQPFDIRYLSISRF